MVKEGRRPGLQLQRDGQPVELKQWADELLERIAPLAELLDRSQGGDEHAKALQAQKAKVSDPALTPSAQVLASMTEHKESFSRFALRQSQVHAEFFRAQALSAEQQQGFESAARQSLEAQAKLEREEDKADFDLFVSAYQASILAISN